MKLQSFYCPDCGKLLFKLRGKGRGVILAWCKFCHDEKEIPLNSGK